MAGSSRSSRSRSSASSGSSRSSSSSSAGSRNRSRERSKSKRRIKKSDPTALRKYVLKKNTRDRITKSYLGPVKRELKSNVVARTRSASPSSQELIFQLSGPQKVRVKKTISFEVDKVYIHMTLYIFNRAMNDEQYEKAMERQISVEGKKTYRGEQKNPMETISQALYYGRKLVRFVRDVVLDKAYLNRQWETTDERGVRDGFQTSVNGSPADYTGMKTESLSRNSEIGYVNTTGLLFQFNQAADEHMMALKLCPSGYKAREEVPNLEECIRLGEKVEADGSTLKFVQEVHLLPMLKTFSDSGFVEEVREYLFNPKEEQPDRRVKFLDRSMKTSFDSDKSTFMKSHDSTTLWGTPMLEETYRETPQTGTSEYLTLLSQPSQQFFTPPNQPVQQSVYISPLMRSEKTSEYLTPLAEIPGGVHPIAIPGPQSLAGQRPGPPHLVLTTPSQPPVKNETPTPKKATTPPPPSGTKRISNDVSLDKSKTPRLTIEVIHKGPKLTTHKHAMTMAVDIGGEACEFTGNISYEGPPNTEFTPKRVLVDGKLLWQQSSDWNPTSVTNSQINMNMTPNSTQKSDK